MLHLTNHAFKNLDERLLDLKKMLTSMTDNISAMLELELQSLTRMGKKDALKENLARGKEIDREVNRLEFAVVSGVQEIIAKYTLSGVDLRFTIGSIKLSTIMERIADKCKNSLKRLCNIEEIPQADLVDRLKQMVNANLTALQSIKTILEDFSTIESETITEKFHEIETTYRTMWEEKFMAISDYSNVVMFAKNQERLADMIVDVKKALYFIHTGEKLEGKFDI